MRFLIRFYDRCFSWTAPLQTLLLLLFRMVWGTRFAMSGWGKLQDIQSVINYFTSLNVPYPVNSAWAAASIETVCGVLLVLGLFSRLAALPAALVMIGAYIYAYPDTLRSLFTQFDKFTQEDPFLYLVTALMVLAFGPGRASLDNLIRKKYA